jgi:hypothetical protein
MQRSDRFNAASSSVIAVLYRMFVCGVSFLPSGAGLPGCRELTETE